MIVYSLPTIQLNIHGGGGGGVIPMIEPGAPMGEGEEWRETMGGSVQFLQIKPLGEAIKKIQGVDRPGGKWGVDET